MLFTNIESKYVKIIFMLHSYIIAKCACLQQNKKMSNESRKLNFMLISQKGGLQNVNNISVYFERSVSVDEKINNSQQGVLF